MGLFISEAYAGSPCVKFSATKTGNQALDNLIVDMGTLCLTASQKADTLGNGIGTGLQYVDAGLTTALGAPYTVGKDRLGDAAYVIGLGTQAGINNIDGLIEETTGNTNVIGGTLGSAYESYTDNTTPGQRTLINTILTLAPFATGSKFALGAAGEAGAVGKTGTGVIINSGEASSAANSIRLNNQLSAEEIASGHAFDKHVVQQGEFKDLNIKTPSDLANHVESIISNPSEVKTLSGGKTAYWDDASQTVVIKNPRASDGGTAFQPITGKNYFVGLK